MSDDKRLVRALEKYFVNPSNIKYILTKTEGPSQSLKVYNMLCAVKDRRFASRDGVLINAINMLKNDALLWSHPTFQAEILKIDEENEFLIRPYEVSDGALTCRKCSCTKIFSYTKQTRSIDEPITVFAKCSECGNRWSEGS